MILKWNEKRKRHEGTRWPHLFSTDLTDAPDETVDASEMASFLDRMAKYTEDVPTSSSASTTAVGDDVAQATTETPEEEDFEGVGATAFVRCGWGPISSSTVSAKNSISSSSSTGGEDGNGCGWVTQTCWASGFTWLCAIPPSAHLATTTHSPHQVLRACLRADVDAAVFTINTAAAADASTKPPQLKIMPLEFTHEAQFDALGYVVASKRDKKFLYVSSDLSYAIIVEGGGMRRGTCFVYRRPRRASTNTEDDSEGGGVGGGGGGGGGGGSGREDDTWSDQFLLELDEAAEIGGDILGRVGPAANGGGEVLGVREIGVGCFAILRTTDVVLLRFKI